MISLRLISKGIVSGLGEADIEGDRQ